jgi:hypothetical protein
MVYLELVDYVPPAPRARVRREREPEEIEAESGAPGVTT